MRKHLYLLLTVLLLAVVVAGCAAPAAPAAQAPAAEATTEAATEAAPAEAATAEATEAAAAEAPAAGAPLYVVINKSADQQYFIDLQNSFVDTATSLGGEAKKFDAKLDPNLGVSLVNDAISAGAKGIAITVPDQTIGPAIAKAAKDAGVVLIATDDSIVDDAGNPVPFVGFDGKDMGKKVGEAAAKLLTDSGWLDGHRQEGRRPLRRSPDPLGLQRPHRQREGCHHRRRRAGSQHLPRAVHRRGAVGPGCRRPHHHGQP